MEVPFTRRANISAPVGNPSVKSMYSSTCSLASIAVPAAICPTSRTRTEVAIGTTASPRLMANDPFLAHAPQVVLYVAGGGHPNRGADLSVGRRAAVERRKIRDSLLDALTHQFSRLARHRRSLPYYRTFVNAYPTKRAGPLSTRNSGLLSLGSMG